MPGGDGSDRSGGQWRAETQPNGTGRTDRTGEGRSGRNRTKPTEQTEAEVDDVGGMWGAATAATTAATAAATAATAATNIRVLLPCLPASSFLFWMPPSFFGCLRSSFSRSSLTARSVCDAPDDTHDDDSPTSAFVPLASHLHPLPSPSMLPSPWVGRVPRSLFGCRVPPSFFGGLNPCLDALGPAVPLFLLRRLSAGTLPLIGCLRPWIS